MAEIVEFKRNISMRGNYDCIQDLSTDNLSGRYVRESDYNALMERHRRLVSALDEFKAFYDADDDGTLVINGFMDKIFAALAEEVDDGPVDNH